MMTNTYGLRVRQAKEAIENADGILIGAGAGLSDAAGLHYAGKRFTDHFAPFIEKYELEDMYSSSFYPFETEEERWAYWAVHIDVNRFSVPAAELYRNLLELVQQKEYFVITTNVESQFYKAGFPREKVYAVQGDYGKLQCAKGCHDTLYDNEELVNEMLAHTRDCKIPASLVPECPVCSGAMNVHLRADVSFVQDENWYWMEKNYEMFLKKHADKGTVYLELGVGFNTAGIIRIPFEQLTYQNKNATLIRLNRHQPHGMKENAGKTISFTEDMSDVIGQLLQGQADRGCAPLC